MKMDERARHAKETVVGEAGIVVSARRNVLRFSPHLYNEADDIQQALTAIDHCLT